MYISHWINVWTGELFTAFLKAKEPKGVEWKKLSSNEYHLFLLAISCEKNAGKKLVKGIKGA